VSLANTHANAFSRTHAVFAALGISLTLLLSGCIDNGDGFSSPGSSDSGTGSGFAGATGSGEVALSWEPPDSRDDGTPLMASEVDKYKVAYGTTSGDYPETLETSGTSARINSLPTGETYYFTVRVQDHNGLTSEYAPEVSVEVN